MGIDAYEERGNCQSVMHPTRFLNIFAKLILTVFACPYHAFRHCTDSTVMYLFL